MKEDVPTRSIREAQRGPDTSSRRVGYPSDKARATIYRVRARSSQDRKSAPNLKTESDEKKLPSSPQHRALRKPAADAALDGDGWTALPTISNDQNVTVHRNVWGASANHGHTTERARPSDNEPASRRKSLVHRRPEHTTDCRGPGSARHLTC